MQSILYVITGCPYCKKVLDFAQENSIELDIRNITESEDHLNELLEKGGRRQAPYLDDMDNNVSMYESDAIVAHLKSTL